MKHVKTGMCIIDTRRIQSEGRWGNVTFVELSNNCLDPAAQFRFRDNGAMLNLIRPGCLSPHYKAGTGYYLEMFYIYVNSGGLNTIACTDRADRDRYAGITHTTWGGLSIKYKVKTTLQTMCVVPKTYQRLADNQGIDPYIGLTSCNDTEDKRFNFGKLLPNSQFVLIHMCHAH